MNYSLHHRSSDLCCRQNQVGENVCHVAKYIELYKMMTFTGLRILQQKYKDSTLMKRVGLHVICFASVISVYSIFLISCQP